jgi:aryl-alcohol dehydrogenase-like predicted oxidoreductase
MAQQAIPTATLGRSGLEITRVGFGAWAIGGPWEFGWGEQDDEQSVAAIRRAVELGVNWIDTAAVYGFGRSESVVGQTVRELPEPRPYVFTKCGLVEAENRTAVGRLERDSVRRECEASLERLGVDAIDLYQVHWPDPDEDVEEAWTELARLKDEGLVRHIGVSNFDVSQLERAEAIAPVETLQPPYSLISRRVEREILPWCEEHGVGVIVYSPMASGLLTGKMTRERIAALPDDDWRKRASHFTEPKLTPNLELVERLRAVGDRRGAPAGAVAVAWTLRNPAVDGAIVGFRRPDQVDELVGAAAIELTDAEGAELERG